MSKKKVKRAGVIPYVIEDGKIEMMFMKPSNGKYGGAEFQLAKGKVEKDEKTKKAAFREANEELGLFKPNCKNIEKLGTFLGYTTVYICEVKDKAMFGDTCDETEETRWMSPETFQKEGRGLHKPLVKSAVRMIQKQIVD